MSKLLARIVTCLLVPCLLIDPALAELTQIHGCHATSSQLFNTQAFAGRAIQAEHLIVGERVGHPTPRTETLQLLNSSQTKSNPGWLEFLLPSKRQFLAVTVLLVAAAIYPPLFGVIGLAMIFRPDGGSDKQSFTPAQADSEHRSPILKTIIDRGYLTNLSNAVRSDPAAAGISQRFYEKAAASYAPMDDELAALTRKESLSDDEFREAARKLSDFMRDVKKAGDEIVSLTSSETSFHLRAFLQNEVANRLNGVVGASDLLGRDPPLINGQELVALLRKGRLCTLAALEAQRLVAYGQTIDEESTYSSRFSRTPAADKGSNQDLAAPAVSPRSVSRWSVTPTSLGESQPVARPVTDSDEGWIKELAVDLGSLPVGTLVYLGDTGQSINQDGAMEGEPIRYLVKIEEKNVIKLWFSNRRGCFIGSAPLLGSIVFGAEGKQVFAGRLEAKRTIEFPYFLWKSGEGAYPSTDRTWPQAFPFFRVLYPNQISDGTTEAIPPAAPPAEEEQAGHGSLLIAGNNSGSKAAELSHEWFKGTKLEKLVKVGDVTDNNQAGSLLAHMYCFGDDMSMVPVTVMMASADGRIVNGPTLIFDRADTPHIRHLLKEFFRVSLKWLKRREFQVAQFSFPPNAGRETYFADIFTEWSADKSKPPFEFVTLDVFGIPVPAVRVLLPALKLDRDDSIAVAPAANKPLEPELLPAPALADERLNIDSREKALEILERIREPEYRDKYTGGTRAQVKRWVEYLRDANTPINYWDQQKKIEISLQEFLQRFDEVLPITSQGYFLKVSEKGLEIIPQEKRTFGKFFLAIEDAQFKLERVALAGDKLGIANEALIAYFVQSLNAVMMKLGINHSQFKESAAGHLKVRTRMAFEIRRQKNLVETLEDGTLAFHPWMIKVVIRILSMEGTNPTRGLLDLAFQLFLYKEAFINLAQVRENRKEGVTLPLFFKSIGQFGGAAACKEAIKAAEAMLGFGVRPLSQAFNAIVEASQGNHRKEVTLLENPDFVTRLVEECLHGVNKLAEKYGMQDYFHKPDGTEHEYMPAPVIPGGGQEMPQPPAAPAIDLRLLAYVIPHDYVEKLFFALSFPGAVGSFSDNDAASEPYIRFQRARSTMIAVGKAEVGYTYQDSTTGSKLSVREIRTHFQTIIDAVKEYRLALANYIAWLESDSENEGKKEPLETARFAMDWANEYVEAMELLLNDQTRTVDLVATLDKIYRLVFSIPRYRDQEAGPILKCRGDTDGYGIEMPQDQLAFVFFHLFGSALWRPLPPEGQSVTLGVEEKDGKPFITVRMETPYGIALRDLGNLSDNPGGYPAAEKRANLLGIQIEVLRSETGQPTGYFVRIPAHRMTNVHSVQGDSSAESKSPAAAVKSQNIRKGTLLNGFVDMLRLTRDNPSYQPTVKLFEGDSHAVSRSRGEDRHMSPSIAQNELRGLWRRKFLTRVRTARGYQYRLVKRLRKLLRSHAGFVDDLIALSETMDSLNGLQVARLTAANLAAAKESSQVIWRTIHSLQENRPQGGSTRQQKARTELEKRLEGVVYAYGMLLSDYHNHRPIGSKEKVRALAQVYQKVLKDYFPEDPQGSFAIALFGDLLVRGKILPAHLHALIRAKALRRGNLDFSDQDLCDIFDRLGAGTYEYGAVKDLPTETADYPWWYLSDEHLYRFLDLVELGHIRFRDFPAAFRLYMEMSQETDSPVLTREYLKRFKPLRIRRNKKEDLLELPDWNEAGWNEAGATLPQLPGERLRIQAEPDLKLAGSVRYGVTDPSLNRQFDRLERLTGRPWTRKPAREVFLSSLMAVGRDLLIDVHQPLVRISSEMRHQTPALYKFLQTLGHTCLELLEARPRELQACLKSEFPLENLLVATAGSLVASWWDPHAETAFRYYVQLPYILGYEVIIRDPAYWEDSSAPIFVWRWRFPSPEEEQSLDRARDSGERKLAASA